MCKYIKEGHKCRITNNVCPYMYYCEKKRTWTALKSMPKKCKVAEKAEIPKGYCRVCFSRKGYLYVDIGNNNYMIKNPFDYVPKFVRVYKTKQGEFKIKGSFNDE